MMKKLCLIIALLTLSLSNFAQADSVNVTAKSSDPEVIKMNEKITTLIATKEKLMAANKELEAENKSLKSELKAD
jgi:cell division protein FtsB